MLKKIDKRFIINLVIFLVFIAVSFIYQKVTGKALTYHYTLAVVLILFVYNYIMLKKQEG